jgi:hypothetical protein
VRGDWAKRFEEQWDAAEDDRLCSFVGRLRKDKSKGLSREKVEKRVSRFLAQHDRATRARVRKLACAEARDSLDDFIEYVRKRAQPFKRPRPPWDEDFQDIDTLACHLKPVVEALERYEKLAKLSLIDPYPLNEIVNALNITFMLGAAIQPLVNNSKQEDLTRQAMIRVRQPRSVKHQVRMEEVAVRALLLWAEHPKWRQADVARKLAEDLTLKTNTVEKMLVELKKLGRLSRNPRV